MPALQSLRVAGRDHRRGHCGLGDRRKRRHHHQSRTGCSTASPAKLRPGRRLLSGLDFPINPERVAPLLRNLVSPTKTRARIYDRDGLLILDSANLYGRGDVMRSNCRRRSTDKPGISRRRWNAIRTWLDRGDLPHYREFGPERARATPKSPRADRRAASWCASTSAAKSSSRSRCRCSASAPWSARCCCRRRPAISTRWSPRSAGDPATSLIAAAVKIALSLLLAGTIAGPVRRLPTAPSGCRRIRTARRNPRFHPPPRRDRPSFRRAARHDQRALQPHRGDRDASPPTSRMS